MAFYKAGKELADIHLNYEQGINVQTTGHDGDYIFFAEMPMFAHRFFGVKVIGDIDIWQNEWANDTYQHFAVEKMTKTENSFPIRHASFTTVISPSRTYHSKHTSTLLMASPPSSG